MLSVFFGLLSSTQNDSNETLLELTIAIRHLLSPDPCRMSIKSLETDKSFFFPVSDALKLLREKIKESQLGSPLIKEIIEIITNYVRERPFKRGTVLIGQVLRIEESVQISICFIAVLIITDTKVVSVNYNDHDVSADDTKTDETNKGWVLSFDATLYLPEWNDGITAGDGVIRLDNTDNNDKVDNKRGEYNLEYFDRRFHEKTVEKDLILGAKYGMNYEIEYIDNDFNNLKMNIIGKAIATVGQKTYYGFLKFQKDDSLFGKTIDHLLEMKQELIKKHDDIGISYQLFKDEIKENVQKEFPILMVSDPKVKQYFG